MADDMDDDDQSGGLLGKLISPLRAMGIDPDQARANPGAALEAVRTGQALAAPPPTPVAPAPALAATPASVTPSGTPTKSWQDYARTLLGGQKQTPDASQRNAQAMQAQPPSIPPTPSSTPAATPAAVAQSGNLAVKLPAELVKPWAAHYAKNFMAQTNPAPANPAPAMPTSIDSSPQPATPNLPATTPTTVNPPSQADRAEAEFSRVASTGPGVDQIENKGLRVLAKIGDVAGTALTPGLAEAIPGTTLHHQQILDQDANRVADLEDWNQKEAQLADTQSQTSYRQQQANREAAQAQADTVRQPTPQEAADYGLDPNASYTPAYIGKAAIQAAKNRATLETHTGGQSHKLTADDAALVGAPALEGETISNDAWQKMVSGVQRNTQSGKNNAANNATRVQTTGMRDATSAGNSERAHQPRGAGTPKPIPAGVRDRIESQKDTAVRKAKADFDNGGTMNDYLNAWQAAQNDYEDRLGAQTGEPISHTDIRSNVDAKGNWLGKAQPTAAPPQAQQAAAKHPGFTTRGGSHVSVGDPVNVGGRKGTVTGFNPVTGKAQVEWENAQ